MFTSNPFAPVMDALSPLAMNVYPVLMIVAVLIGTLFDIYHPYREPSHRARSQSGKA